MPVLVTFCCYGAFYHQEAKFRGRNLARFRWLLDLCAVVPSVDQYWPRRPKSRAPLIDNNNETAAGCPDRRPIVRWRLDCNTVSAWWLWVCQWSIVGLGLSMAGVRVIRWSEFTQGWLLLQYIVGKSRFILDSRDRWQFLALSNCDHSSSPL